MSPALVEMLTRQIDAARNMKAAAEALGQSFTAALPFKVGDCIGGIKVERITFESGCYMKGGKFHPGFRAIGPIMISSTLPGSSRKTVVFDLYGLPVTLSQS